MVYFSISNVIIFLSIAVYLVYDHYDAKRVSDEREEFLKLKTFDVVQKVNTFTLLFLAILYFFIPNISGPIVISVLIVSSLYTEIFAKLYFRKKF